MASTIESQQYSSMHVDASTSASSSSSSPQKKKSSSFKMKLKEYLEAQNVKPTDVAKVLFTFKLFAWSTWVILVPFCGKVRPIRRLGQMSGPQRLKSWFIKTYPNRYERWEEHVIKGSEWIAKHKTIRWIPDAFGQRHRDFGLSIAEATVLYKVLFPIWAPLEFMYIVRLYKKKWAFTDLNPLPGSYDEFTDSYQQASEVNVFEISADENDQNGNRNDKNNRNNNGNGSGGTPTRGGTGSNHKNNTNAKMSIHTMSSSCGHLMGQFIEQRNYYHNIVSNIEW
eukprot:CAMPEP_0201581650 /NCGR_PEP_ID=MMETSP0190_2-20130828/72804_1 /ASSEMBLY_ACC=CAM_ASM_000263 /TAXON_ID=37353 /ORGANISM="Rosalina sp." /LENGTH=281 /DNA_ID=CAMNT_0048020077 /DNA_START=23 /DNA_END=866 /DNA_ORIENTATION=-